MSDWSMFDKICLGILLLWAVIGLETNLLGGFRSKEQK